MASNINIKCLKSSAQGKESRRQISFALTVLLLFVQWTAFAANGCSIGNISVTKEPSQIIFSEKKQTACCDSEENSADINVSLEIDDSDKGFACDRCLCKVAEVTSNGILLSPIQSSIEPSFNWIIPYRSDGPPQVWLLGPYRPPLSQTF